MSSSRLPGKVMSLINTKPMIYWELTRIQQASKVDSILVATSEDSSDDVLAEYIASMGVAVFRGNLNNVHERFLNVLKTYNAYDCIVRLTGDCPLVMPKLLDTMIEEFSNMECDYYSNCHPPTYPDGLDIEIFSRNAFLQHPNNLTIQEKEHVTLKFINYPETYRILNKEADDDYSSIRLTVDYEEDLDFIREIFGNFVNSENKFELEDVLQLLKTESLAKPQLSGNLRNIVLRNGIETQ